MSYTKLLFAGLAAALLVTGCGRVAPSGANLSVDSKANTPGGKLGSGYVGGGLIAAGVGSLSGKVIDAASSRGLAGAIVVLEPGGQRLTTDATGAFRATGITSGMYTFKAMMAGMQQITTNGVIVEANQQAQVPEISMTPGHGPSGITSVTYTQETEMGRDGEAPATLIAPLAVAVRGRDVLVLDVNKSAGVKTGIIRQYDGESGQFVGKYGDYTKWLGRNQMRNTVKSIALDAAGNAVVLDGASKVWRWQPDGDKDKDFDIDVADGNDVAISSADGAIFVAHTGGLTKYAADGGNGQALALQGDAKAVAAHKTDLYAISGNLVQKLSADGSMILSFGAAGIDQKTAFTEATDLAIDPRNGNVVVVDKGAKNVYVYDSVGTLIGKVGQGVFDAPVSATIDATGRIYVVDAGKKKVYKFLPTGVR